MITMPNVWSLSRPNDGYAVAAESGHSVGTRLPFCAHKLHKCAEPLGPAGPIDPQIGASREGLPSPCQEEFSLRPARRTSRSKTGRGPAVVPPRRIQMH